MAVMATRRVGGSTHALEATFPEWALGEVDRLLRARARAATPDERAQVELQIAVICDAANRYGRTLAETAEL